MSDALVKRQVHDPDSAAGLAWCSGQRSIVDEICRRAKVLEAVSEAVQRAVEQNEPETVRVLRDNFNSVRDEIIGNVLILARHRLDHGC